MREQVEERSGRIGWSVCMQCSEQSQDKKEIKETQMGCYEVAH